MPGPEKITSKMQDEEEESEIGVMERLKMDKERHNCLVAQHEV